MEINQNIIKIMKRLYNEGYLSDDEDIIGYYGFLKTMLNDEDILQYAMHKFDIDEVDDWVFLRQIFGDMSFSTASQIAHLLYCEDIEISEANCKDFDIQYDIQTMNEAKYVWENYFKDIA